MYVVMDSLEKLYLAGFPFLLAFVSLFPVLTRQTSSSGGCTPGLDVPCTPDSPQGQASAMEFLPLMVTSVYCAIGLVWAYVRLGFIYLNESRYQGQMSEVK